MFRTRFLCLFGAALGALALAAPAFGDVKITDRQYVRHDGGQPVGGLLAGDGATPGLS